MKYKNILWIEDCDTKDKKGQAGTDWLARFSKPNASGNPKEETTSPENISLIEEYFGTEQMPYVHLVKKYLPALEILKKNCNQYDLIVFDLDFKDINIQNNGETYQKILSILKEGHVSPSETNAIHTNFEKIAGYYLYLYLAMQGYPTNRMVILTGNASNYQGNHPDLHLRKNADIIEKQHNSNWLRRYYTGKKNNYYRIRRLVFQACEYWKECLKGKAPEEIPFNQIYYKKNPILTDIYIDMLEHVQMLFPVTIPENPEKIYYQAMQTASSFHEESAKIGNLDNYPDLKKYHSCIRNFRNWTAHNKLKTANQRCLDGEQFALLFCVALRTYFDTNKPDKLKEKPNALSTNLMDYEKLYDFKKPKDSGSVTQTDLSEKLMDIWFSIAQSTNFDGLLLSFDTAIREYGRKETVTMSPCHLFASLWSDSITVHTKLEDMHTIRYSIDADLCDIPCQKAKQTDTNAIFMQYCYQWLVL